MLLSLEIGFPSLGIGIIPLLGIYAVPSLEIYFLSLELQVLLLGMLTFYVSCEIDESCTCLFCCL